MRGDFADNSDWASCTREVEGLSVAIREYLQAFDHLCGRRTSSPSSALGLPDGELVDARRLRQSASAGIAPDRAQVRTTAVHALAIPRDGKVHQAYW